MKIKDEWFKHFRIFLKVNNLYNEFMECFQRQQYLQLHRWSYNELRPNYINVMKKFSESSNACLHEEFGAMIFTFDSFKWIESGVKIPIEFTIKWCTVGFKWGLYCIDHNIEICTKPRFIELIEYWKRQKWIDNSIMTDKEYKSFENIKEQVKQERLNI